MIIQKRADMNPVFFINLNHSLSEWLTNRVNRATFAATSFMSILLAATQGSAVSSEELTQVISDALQADTIYVLQIEKDVATLIVGNGNAILARFSPVAGEAYYEVLEIKNYGEIKTNEILDSMIIKRTIISYYHVEAEEFAVVQEMIGSSIGSDSENTSDDEDNDDDDDDYEDDDDEDDNDEYDDDDDDDDDDDRYYDNDRFYDAESWYDDHLNPPGTIDCGDGYIDDDGVFTEY